MSSSRALLCACLLALLALASAHHNDVQQGLVVCQSNDCAGSNMAEVSHTNCNMYNVTLGSCTQLTGAKLGGITGGYGKLFCDDGKAYIASYGADATCADNNLRTVTVQQADTCAQSIIGVCRTARFAPSSALTAKPYITVNRCSTGTCSGATCATTMYQSEKCYTDDDTTGYQFGKCVDQGSQAYTIMEQSWAGDMHSMHCHNAASANRTLSVSQCYSATVDQFAQYGCGNTVSGAAAFTPAISMLVMLAALLATLRMTL